MEVIIENIATYLIVVGFIISLFVYYHQKGKRNTATTVNKIAKAKELGFNEPVSLHPVINYDICIGSAACITACPEHDILGLVRGKATTINASRCVGHGACFHACPVQAISLCIGTEKRGVELPHISEEFETTIPGIFIAGELGGMGLIKNAVEQGKQAMTYLSSKLKSKGNTKYDVVIVGAGPAGISASLEATKRNSIPTFRLVTKTAIIFGNKFRFKFIFMNIFMATNTRKYNAFKYPLILLIVATFARCS